MDDITATARFSHSNRVAARAWIKMRRAVASLIVIASALLLSGCQPGSAGPLDPAAGDGVTVEADRVALVADSTIEARVTGRWSSMRGNSLTIRYRNASNKPMRIALADIGMQNLADAAGLITVIDSTGVDLADQRKDNDESKVLFVNGSGRPANRSAVLNLPAGATREIDCEFTGFSDARTLGYGDPITATIPLGGRSTKVNFTAARAQWWIFW